MSLSFYVFLVAGVIGQQLADQHSIVFGVANGAFCAAVSVAVEHWRKRK